MMAVMSADPTHTDDASPLEELESLRVKMEELTQANEILTSQKQALASEKQALASEKQALLDERAALIARIHSLTTLLSGHAPKAQPELLKTPVDAGATAEEAEGKQAQRERAEHERLQRAKTKHGKKGKGADGKSKPVNGGGRKPVNPQLPVQEVSVRVPAARRCLADGTPLVTLRWEPSVQEHYVPAGLVRLVHLIEIMGLADTHEVVERAPIPPRIVPRCKYSDALIIEVMVRKYMRGMPFYRVLQDMRAMGSDLSDATLSDLAQAMATFLSPVAQAIRDQVLREAVAHVDETPLPTHDGRRYLWALLAGRQVTFHVGGRGSNELRMILGLPLKDPTPGEQERAAAVVQDRSAISFVNMMADGYSLYDTVLAEAGISRMNCWAHGLRDLTPFAQEPVIAPLVQLIGKLYAVEKQAGAVVEQKELAGQEAIAVYTRLRAERAKHLLDALHAALPPASESYPKGTDQRKAIDFLIRHWPSFTVYADGGELPIDNNDCERAFRMIVVGRKNWMLIGSEDAAQHAAILFSVMESCRLCTVEPRAYLTHVVAHLHAGGTPPAELTPRALAKQFPLRE
jgi:transposase